MLHWDDRMTIDIPYFLVLINNWPEEKEYGMWLVVLSVDRHTVLIYAQCTED